MARGASEADKLYKIGEVCKLADLQPYVLRYWETEFAQLSPGKSGGGQRLYTRAEVDTILRIKELLYRDGFTIAGAKKQLEAEPMTPPAPLPPTSETAGLQPGGSGSDPNLVRTLNGIRKELRSLLTMLDD